MSGALASLRCVWRYPFRRQCAAEHSSLTAPFPAGIALPTHVPLPVDDARVTQKRRLALPSTPFDAPYLPLAPLARPRRRRPPAGLEMRQKAADRSSDVQVATTKPPKSRVMLTMRADLNLWTSNLVGGRGAIRPGGGSRRGHPGAAWEQLKCPRRDAWEAHNNCLNLL